MSNPSLPGQSGDFAKGVSGVANVYDTSPAGLGLSPAYLASASASASSSTSTSGTIFPTSPADGEVFIYTADGTNGVKWAFQYDSSQPTYKWVFVGGAPLSSQVDTSESTTSATYAALATAGPSIIVPFAGDYDVLTAARFSASGDGGSMSYDIGGTGAVDTDAISGQSSIGSAFSSASRIRRQTGLAAVTLTAKYKRDAGASPLIVDSRRMALFPVRVSG